MISSGQDRRTHSRVERERGWETECTKNENGWRRALDRTPRVSCFKLDSPAPPPPDAQRPAPSLEAIASLPLYFFFCLTFGALSLLTPSTTGHGDRYRSNWLSSVQKYTNYPGMTGMRAEENRLNGRRRREHECRCWERGRVTHSVCIICQGWYRGSWDDAQMTDADRAKAWESDGSSNMGCDSPNGTSGPRPCSDRRKRAGPLKFVLLCQRASIGPLGRVGAPSR